MLICSRILQTAYFYFYSPCYLRPRQSHVLQLTTPTSEATCSICPVEGLTANCSLQDHSFLSLVGCHIEEGFAEELVLNSSVLCVQLSCTDCTKGKLFLTLEYKFRHLLRSPCIQVSFVYRPRDGKRKNSVSIADRDKRLFSSPNVQTGERYKAKHRAPSGAGVRNEWSYASYLPYAFML